MPRSNISQYSRAKLMKIISDATAGGDSTEGVITTKRFIIAASACTDEDSAQDIAIYTKTANEGIVNVRVRWGSTKWNYDTSIFFSVGFKPDGGSLDNDSMVLGRSIGGIDASTFIILPYFNYGGSEWVEGDQGSFYPSRWDYFMHSTLAHYQEAGDVYVGITVGAGEVADIDEGTIEVFLDITDPGEGTTIS